MWSDGKFSAVGIYICESRSFFVTVMLVNGQYLQEVKLNISYTIFKHLCMHEKVWIAHTMSRPVTQPHRIIYLFLWLFVDLKTEIRRFYEAKLGWVFCCIGIFVEFLSEEGFGKDLVLYFFSKLSWDYNAIITMFTRRRSRINGDQFLKQWAPKVEVLEGSWLCSKGHVTDFNFQKPFWKI